METPVAEYSENTKREAFGNRHLTEDQNVFQFNAWYTDQINIRVLLKQ